MYICIYMCVRICLQLDDDKAQFVVLKRPLRSLNHSVAGMPMHVTKGQLDLRIKVLICIDLIFFFTRKRKRKKENVHVFHDTHHNNTSSSKPKSLFSRGKNSWRASNHLFWTFAFFSCFFFFFFFKDRINTNINKKLMIRRLKTSKFSESIATRRLPF